MKIKLPLRKPGPLFKRLPQLKLKASIARSRRNPIIEEDEFLEEPEPNMRLSHAFVVVLVLHVIAVAGVFAFNSIKTKQADIFSAVNDETPAKAAAPAASTNDHAPAIASKTSTPSHASSLTQPPPPLKPLTVVSSSNGAKTHELQPGETLTKIAATYGVTIAELQKTNNIADPTKIRAGTVLAIPAAAAVATNAKAAAPAPPASAKAQAIAVTPAALTPKPAIISTVKNSGKIYVVLKGDNPVKIARQFKVAYAELLTLNDITDPRKLQIGQKLKIPASAK